MTEALVVSTVLLWLAVIGLTAAVLALLRQVGVLHERIAPAGALAPAAGLRVGEPAPVLQLEDWQGHSLSVGAVDASGKNTLLLFVSPTCPVCKTVMPIVESIIHRERGGLRLILASDGPRAEHEMFVRQQHLIENHPYVLSTPLGLAYQVGKLPYAVLIDSGGIVRARGLVNTREHVESLFEAMDRGVGTLQEYMNQPRSVA